MTDNKTPLNYGLWCTEHEQPMYKKHDTLGWLKCGACLVEEAKKGVCLDLEEASKKIDSLYGTIVSYWESIEKLKKENEKLKEWKRNMKLFNGTNGIDSDSDCD